jgi:hypothetical protein
MRRFISVFLFLITFCSFGQQDSIRVVITVFDKQFGEPVQNVNLTISSGGTTQYRQTNQTGRAELYLRTGNATFSLSHPMYQGENYSRKVTLLDSVKFAFELQPIRSKEFKEVVVKAPGVPDTVFSSKRLSIADFEIQRNGDLVLLAYPKQLKKGSELLLYNGQEIINSFTVPGTAEELVRDYRGNPHVVCAENVFGIYIEKSRIGIATIEKDYFLKYLAPILDTNKTKMYFSDFNPVYPAFSYFTYDQLDSTYMKICNIQDDLMMELYRSEYKWVDVRTKLWAKNKEYQTGIDAEIWVGANYFTQSIYYKELYAPMFHRNDSLFVFDYYKDKLRIFDAAGEPVDSIAIYHHYQPKSTGWKKQVIQDPITGVIYAVFDKAGYTYIGRIDTKTGEINEKVRMEFRYIDKISVHNNNVYYVYRPFESIQKRYLYKERLPYEFGASKVPYGMETSTVTGK